MRGATSIRCSTLSSTSRSCWSRSRVHQGATTGSPPGTGDASSGVDDGRQHGGGVTQRGQLDVRDTVGEPVAARPPQPRARVWSCRPPPVPVERHEAVGAGQLCQPWPRRPHDLAGPWEASAGVAGRGGAAASPADEVERDREPALRRSGRSGGPRRRRPAPRPAHGWCAEMGRVRVPRSRALTAWLLRPARSARPPGTDQRTLGAAADGHRTNPDQPGTRAPSFPVGGECTTHRSRRGATLEGSQPWISRRSGGCSPTTGSSCWPEPPTPPAIPCTRRRRCGVRPRRSTSPPPSPRSSCAGRAEAKFGDLAAHDVLHARRPRAGHPAAGGHATARPG